MDDTFIEKKHARVLPVGATCRPEEVVIRSRLDAGECGEVQAMANDGDGSARVPAEADRRRQYMGRRGDPQTSCRTTAKLYGAWAAMDLPCIAVLASRGQRCRSRNPGPPEFGNSKI